MNNLFGNKPDTGSSIFNTGANHAQSTLPGSFQPANPANSSLFSKPADTSTPLFGNTPKPANSSPAPFPVVTNMFSNPNSANPPSTSSQPITNPVLNTNAAPTTSTTSPAPTTGLFGQPSVTAPVPALNPTGGTIQLGVPPTSNLFGGTNASQLHPTPPAPAQTTGGVSSITSTNPPTVPAATPPINPLGLTNLATQPTVSTTGTTPPATSLPSGLFGGNIAATSPAQPVSTQPAVTSLLSAVNPAPAAVSHVIPPETPRTIAEKQYRSLHHNLGDMIDKWRRESECYVQTLERHLVIQQETQNEKSVLSSSSKGFSLVKHDVDMGEGRIQNTLDSIEERQVRLLQSVRMVELEIGSLTGPFVRSPNQTQETFSEFNSSIKDIQQIQSRKVSPIPTLEYLNLMYGNLHMIEREVREMNNSLELLLSDSILH